MNSPRGAFGPSWAVLSRMLAVPVPSMTVGLTTIADTLGCQRCLRSIGGVWYLGDNKAQAVDPGDDIAAPVVLFAGWLAQENRAEEHPELMAHAATLLMTGAVQTRTGREWAPFTTGWSP